VNGHVEVHLHVHDSCVQSGRNSRNKLALETQRRLDVLNEIQELIARNGAEAVLRTIEHNIRVRDMYAHDQCRSKSQNSGREIQTLDTKMLHTAWLCCIPSTLLHFGAGFTSSSVHHASTNEFICETFFAHGHQNELR
jgi:Tfp pilus assembly protein PilX